MLVLGINAVFHDPAAALVVDGRTVAAAEEERFSRRKHGKRPVPFSTWELPENAARWCLQEAGVEPGDLDAIAYSYAPHLARPLGRDMSAYEWEGLRTFFAARAPLFLKAALPGVDPEKVRFVPHHVAHAASAYLAGPAEDSSVLVIDGRGESTSHLSGRSRGGALELFARTELPHSLGLFYEELTMHLGFVRSSDEYKVMAMASYGRPRFLDVMRRHLRVLADGTFVTEPVPFAELAPALQDKEREDFTEEHADLAASAQARLEEMLLELAVGLQERTQDRCLVMAGGVALNCVANARLASEGPFEQVWIQPASGDSGTALGAALFVAHALGDRIEPMQSAALGRAISEEEIERFLTLAHIPYERPKDLAQSVAELLAKDAIVAWVQGRSEFGPRALGQRSLLADPRPKANVERLNDIKGREQFRPVAPMVLAERAAEIFEGQLPSPYMLFTHHVRSPWRERIPAVVHIDGTARVQTVHQGQSPLMHQTLAAFGERTGVPVLINTSLNTAGRPMVDDARDALECFTSGPIDVLAMGPFLVRRSRVFGRSA
jgi:carbamoyltransferase